MLKSAFLHLPSALAAIILTGAHRKGSRPKRSRVWMNCSKCLNKVQLARRPGRVRGAHSATCGEQTDAGCDVSSFLPTKKKRLWWRPKRVRSDQICSATPINLIGKPICCGGVSPFQDGDNNCHVRVLWELHQMGLLPSHLNAARPINRMGVRVCGGQHTWTRDSSIVSGNNQLNSHKFPFLSAFPTGRLWEYCMW